MNISVIIPAYNEERSLPYVLHDLPKDLIQEIIVVNNGSTDHTAHIANQHGCHVINEPRKGYGRACLAGIAHVNKDADIIVFIDGDHSDDASQLPNLISPIIHDEFDFVIGSRALGQREEGAMAPQAYYGNKLACFLMRVFWGARFTDLGPFRAIRCDALQKLGMRDRDFGWTIEMQIRAVEKGVTFKEVPVNYRKRIGKSKISGTFTGTISAGYKILWTIFKYRFFRSAK